jgi:Dolichyl-phosphate-mannose-protein mannosyltransferase
MQSATLTGPRGGATFVARLRDRDSASWARLGFAVMCALALFGFFAYPTYPTYDSFYALLWGRDVLHLHMPDFHVYRGPTEHPLAIAFGAFCSLFGQAGARLMVFGSIGSFAAAVAALYRLGRLCFGPVVGLVAALLLLSRFFLENLAAQGYLDISYIALIIWAAILEVERPRRGAPVLVTLAAAGLLRPEAWVLGGAYWLWCALPTRTNRPTLRRQARLLAITLSAPLLWVIVDAIVTGSPTYSLHSTAGLAAELERTQGLTNVVASVWTYGIRIDKLPVLIGGVVGVFLAIWLSPRQARAPLGALVVLLFAYLAEGAAGASVIDRYMLGGATMLLLFCAVTVGGWAMLEPGGALRRVWMVGASALVAFGVWTAATTLSLSSLRTTLAYHNDFHKGLVVALHNRAVRRELRHCPLLSLPNNKLIPDARWILGTASQRNVVARSQARADVQHHSHKLENRLRAGSVAVYPLGAAVFVEAIVDVGDDPHDQIPPAGYRRVFTSHYYAVYANCP